MTLVVVPALNPDSRLLNLATELRALDRDLAVVVVDDGSDPVAAPIFAALVDQGVTVLAHDSNRGKGAALKTAFRWATIAHPDSAVVTADADGQHRPRDIVAVARVTERSSDTIVLGVRDFDGEVPLRSRLGNAVSAKLVSLATRVKITDSQTGLRGVPADAVAWASTIAGDRFEYEAAMLLGARRAGLQLAQHSIATVYIEHNSSSHFRPIRDSVRVLAPVLKFLVSSMLAAALDAALLWIIFALSGWLQGSVVAARLVSASVNFFINRKFVFDSARPLRQEATKYVSLALVLLAANLVIMTWLDAVGVTLLPAKVATEVGLWIVSFAIQRSWVFAVGRLRQRPIPRPLTLA